MLSMQPLFFSFAPEIHVLGPWNCKLIQDKQTVTILRSGTNPDHNKLLFQVQKHEYNIRYPNIKKVFISKFTEKVETLE